MARTTNRNSLTRRRLATVSIALLLIVMLTQCTTSEVAEVEPTRRPAQVAGEAGEASSLYLPLALGSVNNNAPIAAYPPPTVGSQPPNNAQPGSQQNQQETAIFSRVNDERSKAGCQSLEYSDSLAKAAREHGIDMAKNNFFSHTGSDGSKPAGRAKRDGYQFLGGFETITAGQSTPEAAMEAWMNSKAHREILLNCSLRDAGPGFVLDSDGNGFKYYWVMMLGSR